MSPLLAWEYGTLLLWLIFLVVVGQTYRMASGEDEVVDLSGESGNSSVALDQETHGYNYSFVTKVDPGFICPICHLVLRDPVQTECGHRFCKACISRWTQLPQAKCPVCDESLESQNFYPDFFAKRFVGNLKIHCPYEGCSEEPQLKNIKEHLEVCVFCQTPCPNKCGKKLHKLDVDKHVLSECENRQINCEMCNEEILFIEKKHHQSSLCPQLDVVCQYCQEKMKKHQLLKHLEEDCKKMPISCKYKSLGCEHQPTRETLKEHSKENVTEHVDLLLDELKSLSTDFRLFREKEQLSDLKFSDPGSLTHSNLLQHSLSNPLVNPLSTFSNPQFKRILNQSERSFYSDPMVASHFLGLQQEPPLSDFPLGRSDHGLSGTSDTQLVKSELYRMRSSLAEKSTALEDSTARMGKLENKIEEQSRLLREMNTKMMEMESRFCHGCYIWKVLNFRKLRSEAVSGNGTVLHSPGFYSSMYGYRLCIRLNLNGVDSATGKHLSLFVHFMKGEFDDLLPWPFRGRITLSILDQNENHDHRQHLSEVLIAKPRLAAFQKPVTHRNHKGFGYMEYASIDLIERSTYVQNDTLFIRALVEQDVDLLHERPF